MHIHVHSDQLTMYVCVRAGVCVLVCVRVCVYTGNRAALRCAGLVEGKEHPVDDTGRRIPGEDCPSEVG